MNRNRFTSNISLLNLECSAFHVDKSTFHVFDDDFKTTDAREFKSVFVHKNFTCNRIFFSQFLNIFFFLFLFIRGVFVYVCILRVFNDSI